MKRRLNKISRLDINIKMGIRTKYEHEELIKFSREKDLTDLEKLWRG